MGAYEMPFKRITLIPKVDLTAKRYCAVTVDSTGKAILPAAKAAIVGILQEPNNVDQPAQVMVSGVSFVILKGAVAAGAEVEVTADGTVQTLTDGKAVGICLVGGADGAIGSILLNR